MADKKEGEKVALFNAEAFLRDTPLYDTFDISDAYTQLYKLHNGFSFDGHCPQCGKHATFVVPSGPNPPASTRADKDGEHKYPLIRPFAAICTRNQTHRQDFYVRVDKMTYTKIGQFPSLADIAIDENRKYRSLLTPQDGQEFYKAIGLAAHGVGIGSFVYLRRIFERLVDGRFDKHAKAEGWLKADYLQKRMNERISFLKDYLPKFLVDNSSVYGILSKGLHELDEDTCRKFFPVLKNSIGMILEEDWVAQREEKLKEETRKALAQFQPPKSEEKK